MARRSYPRRVCDGSTPRRRLAQMLAFRFLIPCRHFQFGADVRADLDWIVIDEVPDSVVRDSPKLGPFSESANRRFLTCREYPAQAQAGDVRELASHI